MSIWKRKLKELIDKSKTPQSAIEQIANSTAYNKTEEQPDRIEAVPVVIAGQLPSAIEQNKALSAPKTVQPAQAAPQAPIVINVNLTAPLQKAAMSSEMKQDMPKPVASPQIPRPPVRHMTGGPRISVSYSLNKAIMSKVFDRFKKNMSMGYAGMPASNIMVNNPASLQKTEKLVKDINDIRERFKKLNEKFKSGKDTKGMSRDDKIKAALASQLDNPYAESGPDAPSLSSSINRINGLINRQKETAKPKRTAEEARAELEERGNKKMEFDRYRNAMRDVESDEVNEILDNFVEPGNGYWSRGAFKDPIAQERPIGSANKISYLGVTPSGQHIYKVPSGKHYNNIISVKDGNVINRGREDDLTGEPYKNEDGSYEYQVKDIPKAAVEHLKRTKIFTENHPELGKYKESTKEFDPKEYKIDSNIYRWFDVKHKGEGPNFRFAIRRETPEDWHPELEPLAHASDIATADKDAARDVLRSEPWENEPAYKKLKSKLQSSRDGNIDWEKQNTIHAKMREYEDAHPSQAVYNAAAAAEDKAWENLRAKRAELSTNILSPTNTNSQEHHDQAMRFANQILKNNKKLKEIHGNFEIQPEQNPRWKPEEPEPKKPSHLKVIKSLKKSSKKEKMIQRLKEAMDKAPAYQPNKDSKKLIEAIKNKLKSSKKDGE